MTKFEEGDRFTIGNSIAGEVVKVWGGTYQRPARIQVAFDGHMLESDARNLNTFTADWFEERADLVQVHPDWASIEVGQKFGCYSEQQLAKGAPTRFPYTKTGPDSHRYDGNSVVASEERNWAPTPSGSRLVGEPSAPTAREVVEGLTLGARIKVTNAEGTNIWSWADYIVFLGVKEVGIKGFYIDGIRVGGNTPDTNINPLWLYDADKIEVVE